MKQNEIVLGVDHYIKTRPWSVDSWDWTGVKLPGGFGNEIVATVLSKAVPNPDNPRRKDRVEIQLPDEWYKINVTQELDAEGNEKVIDDEKTLKRHKVVVEQNRSRYPQKQIVPARHIIEGVEQRVIRIEQEAYDEIWREALKENESRKEVGNLNARGLTNLIENAKSDVKEKAAKYYLELTEAKEAIEEKLAELDEATERDGYYARSPKEGQKFPADPGYYGNTVISKSNDAITASKDYEAAVERWNDLADLGAIINEETEDSE